jgi:hypothetical protein
MKLPAAVRRTGGAATCDEELPEAARRRLSLLTTARPGGKSRLTHCPVQHRSSVTRVTPGARGPLRLRGAVAAYGIALDL